MSFKTVLGVFEKKDKSQDLALSNGSLGLHGYNQIDNVMIPLFSDPNCTTVVPKCFISFWSQNLAIGEDVTGIERGLVSLDNIAVEYQNAGYGNSVYFQPNSVNNFFTRSYGSNNKAGTLIRIAVDAEGELRTVTFPGSGDDANGPTKKTYYYRRSTFAKYPGYVLTNSV